MSKLVLPQIKNIVELVKYDIKTEEFHPFRGPIFDREGNLRVPEGEDLNDEELIKMDWFVDNIYYS
ncbi:MAG: hypothetical protein ACOX1K_07680 [Defluviitoga tunisiensis]|jgi:basic membrane protein A